MVCCLHSPRSASLSQVCRAAPAARIARQVAPDGSLPAEDSRTKGESYHAFALVALLDLAWLCRSAAPSLPDLFTFSTPDGRSLARAVEWLVPYAKGNRTWDAGPQVRPFDPSAFVKIFRAAAIGYPPRAAAYDAIATRQPNASSSRQLLLRFVPMKSSAGPAAG